MSGQSPSSGKDCIRHENEKKRQKQNGTNILDRLPLKSSHVFQRPLYFRLKQYYFYIDDNTIGQLL